MFSFAQANYFSSELAFDLANYLKTEYDYLPWKTFLAKIRFFAELMSTTSSHGLMKKNLAQLVRAYYQKLDWTENIHTDEWNDRNLRPSILRFACDNDLLYCVTTAKSYYVEWINNRDRDK